MLFSFRCVSVGSISADISHLTLELAQYMYLLAKYDSNDNTGWFTKIANPKKICHHESIELTMNIPIYLQKPQMN